MELQIPPSPKVDLTTPRWGRHRGQDGRRTARAYPAARGRGQADHLQAHRQDAHQQKIQGLLPEKCRCTVKQKSPIVPGFSFKLLVHLSGCQPYSQLSYEHYKTYYN